MRQTPTLARLSEQLDPASAVMLSDMVPTGFHGVELADVQFGDTVCVVGIGPVGLMAVAGAALRGASRLFAVGSRPVCVEAAKAYGATDIINYREGDIVQQILDQTHGKGVDRVILAGGDNDTFRQAVEMVKPGGCIGNVNYLGSGDYVRIPRVEWGCGMGHKNHSRRSDARWQKTAHGEAGVSDGDRPAGYLPPVDPPLPRL